MQSVLLCLHGWGGSKESFTELRGALKDQSIEMLTPDLPGFGAEPEPDRSWTNDDYAAWVEEWIRKKFSIFNFQFSILGHSHGGRIAIKLATRGNLPIAHLYLCAPAGVRRRNTVKRMVGLFLAKTGKAFLSLPVLVDRVQPLAKKLLYGIMRTHDYERASTVMRQTMIKATSEELAPLLPLIRIPTDIFWGTDDGMTPFADAAIVQSGIEGSRLHSFPNVRHAVHRERAKEIADVILATG